MQNIKFKKIDIDTDLEVNSEDTSIPLDTNLNVEEISNGEKYNKLMKLLNLRESEIFDISLYSQTKEDYIRKLENGKFEVRIPLKEEFKNKKLAVYYVDDDNKITEYPVKIENGYAVFETDHFSTYTLGVKENELELETKPNENKGEKDDTPKTGNINFLFNIIKIIKNN